jgi:beta-mannosidase
MAHLQLRRSDSAGATGVDASNARVLPVFYSDNYVSLVPGETRTVTIEAATANLKGKAPIVAMDGWNIAVQNSSSSQVPVVLNVNAQVDHWPVTNLPIVAHTWK